ncbi:MAG TPA: sigma 54-interacting transcriptional regulator [Spirochaetia bacterium]|nr:sigma 54-interacting transcriptional regulator [Spirochaetia bacterium]
MSKKVTRLGVLSPYPEFGELVKEVCDDLPVTVRVEEAILTEAVIKARYWEEHETVDVIIARGPTARMVEAAVKLPVSVVDITNFDILKSLYDGMQNRMEPIAFLDYHYQLPKYDFELLGRMLGSKLHLYSYKTNKDLPGQLDQAILQGMQTIIATGSCLVHDAASRGVHAIYVKSSRESIIDGVKWAMRLAKTRQESTLLMKKLSFILNNIQDGVFSLDENNNLFFFNREAEKLTGLKAHQVLGKPLDRLLAMEPFALLYKDGSEANGELVHSGDHELIVSRTPIRVGDKYLLVVNIQSVQRIRHMEENTRLKLSAKGLVARYSFGDIVGNSPAIKNTVSQASRYAETHFTVLITGESGTGKEFFAHSIHNASPRHAGPFVAVNCAALPENLLESELFGYEEGAFTGARRGGKLGLFELAHGGTIFLDEIGGVSHYLQARLLRTIQEKEVMHVGGDRVIPVDVRVIAATNRKLEMEVAKGDFRLDLYYRLNVLSLEIPPLRSRLDDIPVLFCHFLRQLGWHYPGNLPEDIQNQLKRYAWPGNVRELENFAERYFALGEDDPKRYVTLRESLNCLPLSNRQTEEARKITVEVGSLEEMESQIINQLAKDFSNRKVELANFLKISRSTLWRKLRSENDDIIN